MGIRSLRTNAQRRVKLYNQFLVDVSRVRMFVDGRLHTSGPAELALLILNSTKHTATSKSSRQHASINNNSSSKNINDPATTDSVVEDQAFHLLYLCTQGVLAELYQEAVSKWCTDPNMQLHLLGDGDHRVDLCLSERTVAQTKMFRLVELTDDGDTKEHMRMSLSLFVDARDPSASQHAWATTEVSNEWVLVNLLESGDGVCMNMRNDHHAISVEQRSIDNAIDSGNVSGTSDSDITTSTGLSLPKPTESEHRVVAAQTNTADNNKNIDSNCSNIESGCSDMIVVDGIAGLVGGIRAHAGQQQQQPASSGIDVATVTNTFERQRRRSGLPGDGEEEDPFVGSLSELLLQGMKGV